MDRFVLFTLGTLCAVTACQQASQPAAATPASAVIAAAPDRETIREETWDSAPTPTEPPKGADTTPPATDLRGRAAVLYARAALARRPATAARTNRDAILSDFAGAYAAVLDRNPILKAVPDDGDYIGMAGDAPWLAINDRRLCEQLHWPITPDQYMATCVDPQTDADSKAAIAEVRACAKSLVLTNMLGIVELTGRVEKLPEEQRADDTRAYRETLAKTLKDRPPLAASESAPNWCRR